MARVASWMLAAAFSGLAACALFGTASHRGPAADLAILNGFVVDGTGVPGRTADILVRSGEIVFIGDVDETLVARRTIDATGKVVTPGFIDLHAHGNPLVNPSFENFLLQGVTTVVLGQDGRSPQAAGLDPPYEASVEEWRQNQEPRVWPTTLAQWLDALAERPLDVNVAALSGFGTNRIIAGVGNATVPTDAQLAAEREILEADLKAGAFGLSSGLEYDPDRHAQAGELVALAEVVGRYGGVVMSHLRSEDEDRIAAAIDELARQGETARVHISHLKIVMGRSRRQAEEVLEQLRGLRGRGIAVSADTYPYLETSANMSILYPPWARTIDDWNTAVRTRRRNLEGYLRGRVLQRNGPEAILVVSGTYTGMTLKEVADRAETGFVEVLIDLFGFGGPEAAHRVMAAEVQDAFVSDPDIAIATDGGPETPHPRSWGTYPTFLRQYVIGTRQLPLEAAVRKMTGRPAQILGMNDRGRIAAGCQADLLVLDLQRVESRSTWERMNQSSRGIDYVIIAGSVAAERGVQAPHRYGRLIRRVD